jgi:hypothetical protein
MPQSDTVLDAATRFLRSNPELLELARRGAADNLVSVEALLADTVRRIRRSGFDAVARSAASDASAVRPALLVCR